MDHNRLTPSEVVAANIRVYMKWRGLTQKELAERMTLIGMGLATQSGGRTVWHQRTVGQILTGQRRIDVNELFGLAVALEVTVGALLSPTVDEVADFDAEYFIGDLDPLGFRDFEILLKDLSERESRPRLALSDWSGGDDSHSMPRWVKKLNPDEQAFLDSLATFEAKHPEFDRDNVSLSEVVRLLNEDKRGDDATG